MNEGIFRVRLLDTYGILVPIAPQPRAGTAVNTMSQADKFQDLEETGETLVCFINSSQNDRLRHVAQEQQALFDKHKETKKFLTEILKGW